MMEKLIARVNAFMASRSPAARILIALAAGIVMLLLATALVDLVFGPPMSYYGYGR